MFAAPRRIGAEPRRDSLYILEGLLEQETSVRPTEVMSDSTSYSDEAFGLFRLLDYQFSGPTRLSGENGFGFEVAEGAVAR